MPRKAKQGQGHRNDEDGRGEPPEFRNHGAEVSSVARDAPRGRGRGHGDAVSQVARGDAGTSIDADDMSAEDDGEGLDRRP